MTTAILRLPLVKTRTGLSRSTLYKKIRAGEFPAPVPLGARAVGWLETDINAWLQGCIEAAHYKRTGGKK